MVNIYALIFLGLMMSLHMKATMMKVSDPIIFGHCVKVYFKVGAHFCTLFLVGSETTFGLRTLYKNLFQTRCMCNLLQSYLWSGRFRQARRPLRGARRQRQQRPWWHLRQNQGKERQYHIALCWTQWLGFFKCLGKYRKKIVYIWTLHNTPKWCLLIIYNMKLYAAELCF